MGAGEMKYCRNCGQQISRNAKFCKFCGYQFEVQQEPAAPVMKYCGSCGKENAADAAFCRYCGQPLPSELNDTYEELKHSQDFGFNHANAQLNDTYEELKLAWEQ